MRREHFERIVVNLVQMGIEVVSRNFSNTIFPEVQLYNNIKQSDYLFLCLKYTFLEVESYEQEGTIRPERSPNFVCVC